MAPGDGYELFLGSHVVDVSPLSTLGAMCIANAVAHEDRNRLFQHLLIYAQAATGGALQKAPRHVGSWPDKIAACDGKVHGAAESAV